MVYIPLCACRRHLSRPYLRKFAIRTCLFWLENDHGSQGKNHTDACCCTSVPEQYLSITEYLSTPVMLTYGIPVDFVHTVYLIATLFFNRKSFLNHSSFLII